MGKRKIDDSGENQYKKRKIATKNNGKGNEGYEHRKQNREFSGKDKTHFKDSKSNKRFKNKRNDKTKKGAAAASVKRPQSMQEILVEKLRKIQESKSAGKMAKDSNVVSSAIPDNQNISVELKEASLVLDSENVVKGSKSVDKSHEFSSEELVSNNTTTNDVDDEEDPEKAAMRKKKREKRRLKKLQKEQLKQENMERAGTAKASAIEYLEHWKEKRDDWKFTKVRQVWLLHNMYDKDLLSDEYFQILLSYLEGLKGKSREITVAEAEQIVEKADSEENDEASVEMMERARQIIQLLSC